MHNSHMRLAIGLSVVFAPICASDRVQAEDLSFKTVVVSLIEQVDVPAQEAGVLVKVPARAGDKVSEGDFLAQIDDRDAVRARELADFELNMAQAESENDIAIRLAQKEHEVALAELRRAEEARGRYRPSISASELDAIRLDSERAALQIEQAEHDQVIASLVTEQKQLEVAAASDIVERRKVFAPISGIVVDVKKRQGEWVQPGELVARILRVDRLRVQAFVNLNQLEDDLMGASAVLTVSRTGRPDRRYQGAVSFVDPQIDSNNNQVRVWVDFVNQDGKLRPGMKGRMNINTTAPRSN